MLCLGFVVATVGLSAILLGGSSIHAYRVRGFHLLRGGLVECAPAILRQIELARERGLPHLYLGYWIEHHPKMDYKVRFKPLELLTAEGWKTNS